MLNYRLQHILNLHTDSCAVFIVSAPLLAYFCGALAGRLDCHAIEPVWLSASQNEGLAGLDHARYM